MLYSAYWQRSSAVEQRTHKLALDTIEIINQFIESRREGLSPLSIKYYHSYLKRARQVVGLNASDQEHLTFLEIP